MADERQGTTPDHSVDARRPATARRPPAVVTPQYLERAALHYLERFATSAAQLRRVLMRKVDRSARAHGTDTAAAAQWVDALVARYERSGLVNDATFAEGRVASLRRRGGSARAIQAALAAKGVAADTVAAALADDPAGEEAELVAALAYARRRRLGPFRPAAQRAERRLKDMAAMARAGFAQDVVRRVIDGAAED
jgi:regulatory protein